MPEDLTPDKGKAVVLWTGGKDCALAFYEAEQAGYKVDKLVTFAPPDARFQAHSLNLMRMQAETMGMAHEIIQVTEPYKESYQNAFRNLQSNDGIKILITGDICQVDGYPNWVRECANPLGLEVYTPLWELSREELLDRYVEAGLKVIISCVTVPWLTSDWLGKEINSDTIRSLKKISEEKEFDICGEQGEYHTILLDAPFFSKSICLKSYQRCMEDNLTYLDITTMEFTSK